MQGLRRLFATAVVIFLVDRLTKQWIVEWLDLKTRLFIDVFAPYLTLRMAWNQGVNFGVFNLGADGRWVLIGVSVVICLVVVFWLRSAKGWAAPIAGGLVVGGAIGNAYDRVIYTAVADFLNMSCCGIENPFAFNVADVAIFAGAILLIFIGDTATKKT